ncbi:MFS transporter [Pontivivens nitratireducens]|uniref:MFS transporter n=1 Tax=Pontivivens nitratireducens TaxID=2758038 RepID=UPI001639A837|nr:MFS transporter [Pontibrevibacter nitratireducens]
MTRSAKGQLVVVLGVVTMVQALLSLTVLAAASIAPEITQAYNIVPEMIGYQISIIYFAASAGSIVAGVVIRRFGPATTSMIALLIAASGLAGLASGLLIIAALSAFLIGVGYALTNPSAARILDKHCPPGHRNFVFSLKQTSVPIGGIIGGLALPFIAEAAGWRIAILTAACLCLIACVIVAPFRRRWDGEREQSVRFRGGIFAGLAELRHNRGLRSLAITSFCFSAMQLSLMSYVVSTLVIDLHWTLVAAGAMTAVVQFFGATGRLVWGLLADRTGSPMALLATIGAITTVAAVSMPLLSAESTLAAVAMILVPFGFASIGWNGIMLADIARHVIPEKVGDAAGGVMAVTFIGVVIGPATLALVHGVTESFPLAFFWLALLPIIGAVTALRAHIRARHAR